MEIPPLFCENPIPLGASCIWGWQSAQNGRHGSQLCGGQEDIGAWFG